ncbi:MAG: LysE family transporter [Candidatus Kapaibacterium sp.]
MYPLIIALIIGFITGWLVSMPIGPVNASAITRTLHHGAKQGIATGLGAALMDFIYCGGAAQIHQFLQSSPIINLIFQCIGFFVLIFVGIKTLRSKALSSQALTPKLDEQKESAAEQRVEKMHVHSTGYVQAFLIGVVLYASNVAAIPEWIFISALWRGYHLLADGVVVNLTFALGAGLGTAGWFIFLVKFIAKRQRGFKPTTLSRINLGAGVALLIFSAYFGYEIIFGTNWHAVSGSFQANTGQQ